MGDPKFPRRSFDTPSHPWQGERIKEEAILVKQYGLKNKRELWKAKTILRNLRKQSRELQARLRIGEHQAKIETENLLRKCAKIGLLPIDGTRLDDVLGLSDIALLERRLQTVVYQKGLASTVGQARQFIVHGHVCIDDQKVTIPGYIVTREDEEMIIMNPLSPIADDMHPLRQAQNEVNVAKAHKEEAAEFRKDMDAKKFVKHVPKEIVEAVKDVEDVPAELPTEEVD
ncbi:MAG: 30S ribosomal protein S4 [Methanomassiliicoccales archaeon]|nr:30S ribosomal protein S4 [Methanomassiliicoccales archaeon]TFG56907.1 MAG: 30S ribosomal protein S4 [Methanomassiliicoccus sp.]